MNRNLRSRPCSIPALRPATFVRRAASLTCAGAIFCTGIAALANDANRIRPWPENPHYWQYQGKPLLLIGGSDQDNLFNHPNLGPDGLKAHLDLLVSVGGIRSLRMLTDAMNVFVCEPRNDLLSDRSPNEAFCLAELGRQYAVYFPDGGAVKLDVSTAKGTLQVRWLHIDRNTWQEPQTVAGGGTLELKTPGKGHWAALILRRS